MCLLTLRKPDICPGIVKGGRLMIWPILKIQIEVTNRCNLSCGMCQRKYFNLEYTDIPMSIFKAILDGIHGVHEIILTGWGEPLLHPDLFRFIAICKEKKHVVRLTTNGTLLTHAIADRLIASGIDSISISVDSFGILPEDDPRHNCRDIENKIKYLIQARGSQKKPAVILQPTLHKNRENDIFEVIKKGKELGVDRINIARLDRRFDKNLEAFTSREERSVITGIIAFAKKLKMRTNISCFAIAASKVAYQITGFCPKTYRYLYITHEGHVTPCCGLPKYYVGNILRSPLEEIRHGPAMKKFKKMQGIICEGCNIWEP